MPHSLSRRPLRSSSIAQLSALLATLALPPLSFADAVTADWQGGATGDWSAAANWNPATHFPNNGNGGNTYLATIGASTVNLTENIVVDSLALDSTTLTGAHTLTTGSLGLAVDSASTLSSGLTLINAGPISFSNNAATLSNHGTIQFGGSFSAPVPSTAVLTNEASGTIRFTPGVSASVGNLNNAAFSLVNHGTIFVDNGQSNSLHAPLTQSGLIHVTGGSSLFLQNSFTQTAGELRLSGGSLSAAPAQTLDFQGGLLRADGFLSANLSLNATAVEIGAATTTANLAIFGNVALLTGSSVSFDLAGTVQGGTYDHIAINGGLTLGGTLDLRLSSAFATTIQGSDEFTVLTATSIAGTFSNIYTGQRIALPDGAGTLLVTITGTEIKLGSFSAIPEPATWSALAGLAALALTIHHRRSRHQA